MGQKVHPIAFRLGINKPWLAKWYKPNNSFATTLEKDIKLREFFSGKLRNAGVSKIEIERLAKDVKINILALRPGNIIGKSGKDMDALCKEASKIVNESVHINIKELKRPEVDAILVAQMIAQQLEKRVSFRRAMKKAINNAMRSSIVKGIKVKVSGRLGGAEIARSEWLREGAVPLHTLRQHIDYGVARASTTYGIIGIKVWICKDANAKSRKSSFKQKGFHSKNKQLNNK